MCTVTLELPDELVELAQKQDLLSPAALEAYIRKSLERPVFFKAKGGKNQDESDSELEIKEQLAGGFSPELFGKGEICGDIIGPFHEEWADSDALKVSD